jgi:hypothetical protein
LVIDGLKNETFDNVKAMDAVQAVHSANERKVDMLKSCIKIIGITGIFITFFMFRVEKHNEKL